MELLSGLHQRASFLTPKPFSPWQIKCLEKAQIPPLPDHKDLTDLVNGFDNFFVDKISNIMRNVIPMESNPTDPKYIEHQYTTDMKYSSFKQITAETITNIIRNALSRFCELYPLPISLVKEFTTVLAPTLTKLENTSNSTGKCSGNLKGIFFRPLVKNIGLSVIFRNFRPVSNLSYL